MQRKEGRGVEKVWPRELIHMAEKNLLVIDDDVLTCETLADVFKDKGYSVTKAGTAGEAINKAKKTSFDVALIDIKLPDMDGTALLREFKKKYPEMVCSIITGHASFQNAIEALENGASGYFVKPMVLEDVLLRVEEAVEKQSLQRKLRESEDLYRTLVQTSPDAVSATDLEGNITYVSNRAIEMYGFESAEELLGRNFLEFIAPEECERAMKGLQKIMKEEFVRNVEYTMLRKDGSRFMGELSASLIKDVEGKPKALMAIIRDITERKRSEEEKERLQSQLVQSEKMAGVGTLASGIAHEFNNLLQIMRGHTEFAQRTKKNKDIEDALDIVINTSDRVAKIIGDLLTFSRQEPSEKELCDITESIETVLSLTEDQLQKRNIEVVRKYGRTPKIEINRGEMQQVFLNIVTNARDAMLSEGGRLKISVKQVKENVEVRISDTGEGIGKEHLGEVFEPFYTTKGAAGGDSKLQGTGLGLSVSYGIVKRHRGTIEVESDVGKGTAFTVKLPVR